MHTLRQLGRRRGRQSATRPSGRRLGRDTWLTFQRALGQTIRNPVWVFVMMAQPLFYLVLFGPLLERVDGDRRLPRRRRLQRLRPRTAGAAGAVRHRVRRLLAGGRAALRGDRATAGDTDQPRRTAARPGRARPRGAPRPGPAAAGGRPPVRTRPRSGWRGAGRGPAPGHGPGLLGHLLHPGPGAAQRGRLGAAAEQRGAPDRAAVGRAAPPVAGARHGCSAWPTSTPCVTSSTPRGPCSTATSTRPPSAGARWRRWCWRWSPWRSPPAGSVGAWHERAGRARGRCRAGDGDRRRPQVVDGAVVGDDGLGDGVVDEVGRASRRSTP